MTEAEQRLFLQWLHRWMQIPANKKLLRQWMGVKRIPLRIPRHPVKAARVIEMWNKAGAEAYKLFSQTTSDKTPEPAK